MNTNEQVGAQLDALGDATRRTILELVAQGPRAVGELADALPVSRPAVSQHLKVLKNAGLLAVRRNGTRNIYAPDPAGVALLRGFFEHFLHDAHAAFTQLAEHGRAEPQ